MFIASHAVLTEKNVCLFPGQKPVLDQEGLWFVCCCCFISGAPEGSTDSGSGETGDRTGDALFTWHSAYPLRHGGFLCFMCIYGAAPPTGPI